MKEQYSIADWQGKGKIFLLEICLSIYRSETRWNISTPWFWMVYECSMHLLKHHCLGQCMWCAIYLFYINGKSTYLAGVMYSWMLMCYIDLFGQQVCDNLFFYQHKKGSPAILNLFWCTCAIWFFIWMENFLILCLWHVVHWW